MRLAVLYAAGYNVRWLMRAMLCLDLKILILHPLFLALLATIARTMRVDQFRQLPALSSVTSGSGAG